MLTSANEGTPVTIIEALAAGEAGRGDPDVGGVADVVDEGETGYLVRAGDTHALAERLRADRRRPRAAGAPWASAGRERMLERYAVSAARRTTSTRSTAGCSPRGRATLTHDGSVAGERDLAVGLTLDPGTPPLAHPLQRPAVPSTSVTDHAPRRAPAGPAAPRRRSPHSSTILAVSLSGSAETSTGPASARIP